MVEEGVNTELMCALCAQLLVDPLNLPCSHNVCSACAHKLVTSSKDAPAPLASGARTSSGAESDQSEDSGYRSMQEIHACLHQQLREPIFSLECPRCQNSFFLDERGVEGLTRNRILERLVEQQKTRDCEVPCQLCDDGNVRRAEFTCEQCEVSYCATCIAVYHPKRGPLAAHSLVKPQLHKTRSEGALKCSEHGEEGISMYCALCKTPVCYVCFEDGRHKGHDLKALVTTFKEQKKELADAIELLQSKNNQLTKFSESLKNHKSMLDEDVVEFESLIVAKIDDVIRYLEQKKLQLIDDVTKIVASKTSSMTSQQKDVMKSVGLTRDLVKYSREVQKEADPSSFLLVSSSLCSRITSLSMSLIGEKTLVPRATSDLELVLSTDGIIEAINKCNFQKSAQKQRIKKPVAPTIAHDQCSVTNDTIKLNWKSETNPVDNYTVEIDDGAGGPYQVVHCTKECFCLLTGLQFDSTYKARILCANQVGLSEPSTAVYLTTPKLAVFHFDRSTSHPDIVFSNNCSTITCKSFENRVAMSNVGFTRGKHYWEVRVDRYEGNPDPAIGIAQEGCTKDAILGKDAKAWSVYVDSSRSWFQHSNAHLFRSEGGVETGSKMGMLVDLDKQTLTFYRNHNKHGPIKFPSLEGFHTVYPAFSLNRHVTATLFTGLSPPNE